MKGQRRRSSNGWVDICSTPSAVTRYWFWTSTPCWLSGWPTTFPLLELVHARQLSLHGMRGLGAAGFTDLVALVTDGRFDPGRRAAGTIGLDGVEASLRAMDGTQPAGIAVAEPGRRARPLVGERHEPRTAVRGSVGERVTRIELASSAWKDDSGLRACCRMAEPC